VRTRGSTLANGMLDATLEADGSVTLRDRRSGQRYAGLLRLESEGDAGDTYTFQPVAGSLLAADGLGVCPHIVARGPLAAAVEGQWTFAGVDVRLRLILLAGEPFVRCVLDLDNRATNRRLRARVPAGIVSPTAIAGTSFGAIERAVESLIEPTEAAATPEGPEEAAVVTSPAHRYVAAAHGDRGLAIFAPGFFEYEWTGSDLAMTLLRSVGDLSRGDLATRPGHAGWVTPTPGAQCIGRDRIELAIGPVTASDLGRTDRLERSWEDAFLPVRGVWLRDAGVLRPAPVGIELEGQGLVLSAAKPAEDGDGMILRCWNAGDATTVGRARIHPRPRQAERSAGDERGGQAIPLDPDGSVPFRAGPREIVTLRIR
jgi:Alpha-mannosidase